MYLWEWVLWLLLWSFDDLIFMHVKCPVVEAGKIYRLNSVGNIYMSYIIRLDG